FQTPPTGSEHDIHDLDQRLALNAEQVCLLALRELRRPLALRRRPRGAPEVKIAPALCSGLRVRPQHVLREPAGIHAIAEELSRRIAGKLRDLEWTLRCPRENPWPRRRA